MDAFTGSSEDLFERLSASEIRRALDRTRTESEKKRCELQQLVGSRYHDLIHSADHVLEMGECARALQTLLDDLPSGLEAVCGGGGGGSGGKISSPGGARAVQSAGSGSTANLSSAAVSSGAASAASVSSDIRLVLQAPGAVWEDLKAGRLLSATTRYLTARAAHDTVADDATADTADTADTAAEPETALRSHKQTSLCKARSSLAGTAPAMHAMQPARQTPPSG